MIPKVIHYCWFGGNELPESALNCIESWKKYCPDYEIKEWNESNFDINSCAYVKEAYEAKRWAFVSDYARFKILYENGGVYFDTDVELIRPIDDMIARGSFMGAENTVSGKKGNLMVNPGLGVAVAPKDALYRELTEAYHTRHFMKADGSLNLKTVVAYTTELLKKKGLEERNEIQEVAGIYVYPKEFFCPMDYETGELSVTEQTRSIHHYSATWHSKTEEYAMTLRRKLNKCLPRKVAAVMSFCVAKIRCEGWKSYFKYVFGKMKK